MSNQIIERFLDVCMKSRTNGLIKGPPGVGKSAAIQNWAKNRGLDCWIVIASLREPTDFAGLPVVSKKTLKCEKDGLEFPIVHFAPPRFAAEAAMSKKGAFIFLDEITTAPPATQAALLRAVQDRAFGDLELDPKDVMIGAAANPPEMAAGGWDLAPPLANRFVHRAYSVDAQDWVQEFPHYWGSPPKIEFGQHCLDEIKWSTARSLIAGFVRTRPNKLLELPQAEAMRGEAWPSPRTWDFASRRLATIMQDGLPQAEATPFIADAVGQGITVELMAWLKEINLPDPWSLLKDPSSYRHSNRSDVTYAVLSSVVAAALTDLTPDIWSAAWSILGTAARAGSKDVAAGAAGALAKKFKSPPAGVKLPKPTKDVAPFLPLLRAGALDGSD